MTSPVESLQKRLEDAILAQDPDAFEFALVEVSVEDGAPLTLADLLARAIGMSWHRQHENLATLLQIAKDPASVEALFEAALSKHTYLAYDTTRALTRKCTWALADIGTPEAKRRLLELAIDDDAVIAGFARKRLDSWVVELPRKAGVTTSPPTSPATW